MADGHCYLSFNIWEKTHATKIQQPALKLAASNVQIATPEKNKCIANNCHSLSKLTVARYSLKIFYKQLLIFLYCTYFYISLTVLKILLGPPACFYSKNSVCGNLENLIFTKSLRFYYYSMALYRIVKSIFAILPECQRIVTISVYALYKLLQIRWQKYS